MKGFKNKEFLPTMIMMAVPITIQSFITSSLNLVDNLMVGKLGEESIASVGLANQYIFIFTLCILGINAGASVFMSQFWGKKDLKNIKKVLGLDISIGLIVSTLFALGSGFFSYEIMEILSNDLNVIELGAKYLQIVSVSCIFINFTQAYSSALRSTEQPSVPMYASIVGVLINAFLNWVFIFGNLGAPAMGVKGAAIATLIARVLETTILIAYIYISKSVLAGNMKELFSFSRDFVKMIFITMIPVLLNEGCWGLGSVMYNVIYGRIGTQAIASVQIATTVYNLFMVVIFGIGSASLVIVGNEIGRGDKDKGYKYGKKCVMLGCIVGIILSLGLILLSNQIVTLYDVSEQVRIWARNILYVIAFIMVIRVYNIIIIVGVLRGGGDAKVSLAIEASTMWLIGVPVAFIGAFILKLPVYQVYALCTLEEIVKGVFCLRRFKSKKWINNLVEQ